MKKIADTVEESQFMRKNKFPRKMIDEERDSQAMAIGMSIADMARKMKVKAVIALTASGFTPSMLAEAKLSVPILACCPDKNICRCITLNEGHTSIHLTKYIDQKCGDNLTIEDGLVDESYNEDLEIEKIILKENIKKLPQKEQFVLKQKYFKGDNRQT